jgi:branched-chain amino acid transport system ATP-binding protein
MSLLEVTGLTRSFGGLMANQDVSFRVEEGEILGLIGPNGAGKSTLFDLLTGFYVPDRGDVRFRGHSLAGLRPDRISRAGIARTFQKLRPFLQMTVLENVMVGALQHTLNLRHARERALEALSFVGLLEKRHDNANRLSTGQRKRLEMARAMATQPRLLLMDEVTAGVDMRSIPGLIELVTRMQGQGLTLIVIEHNMQVLMSLANRIVALHLGRKIAEGTPEAVRADRDVIESYLGAAYA